LVNLADRVRVQRLFGLSALGAALMKAVIAKASGPVPGL
jgi:hypothetical protein